MIQLLQNQAQYNNHEYMYSTLALMLSLLDCHQTGLLRLADIEQSSAIAVLGIALSTMYLMVHNGLYGIANHVALVGMVPIWTLLIHLLGTVRPRGTSGWSYWVLQMYVGGIYWYAGLTKLSLDWLSDALPRELLLHNEWADVAACRGLVDLAAHRLGLGEELFFSLLARAGLLLDLFAGPGLLAASPWLRALCALLLACFHLLNHRLFVLETFPWVMLSALALAYPNPAPWMGPRGWKAPPLPALLLLLGHLLLPLPCGLEAVLDRGEGSWGSRCGFFAWRMMARSAAGSCSLRLSPLPAEPARELLLLLEEANPTGELQYVVFKAPGSAEDREVALGSQAPGPGGDQQTPLFEDRLWTVARALAASSPGPVSVFADAWLQVRVRLG